MKKLIVFITISLFIIAACHSEKPVQEIRLKVVKQIELELEEGQRAQTKLLYYSYINNNEMYLSYYDYNKSILHIHRINNQFEQVSSHTLNIAAMDFKRGYKNLISYKVINEDSILLFINPAYGKYYTHDSSLYLVNNKGELLKCMNLDQVPVSTWNKVIKNDYNCTLWGVSQLCIL